MRAGYKFDVNGNIIKSKVYIVYGSPGSGKTTYVKNNKKDGDLVVDIDLIKQSLSMGNNVNGIEYLTDITLKVRDYIYTLIQDREVISNDIWVVACLPTYEERESLRKRLNAELIFIEATESKCIARVMADSERLNKGLQVNIIRKWFKEYFYEEE